MNKWTKSWSMLVAIVMIAVLSACGSTEEAGGEEKSDKKISIGQVSWAENIAVTNMWKVILEDKGYDVKLTNLNMGSTMAALKSGDLDASLEIWLPVQDANYLESYQDSVNFSDATWFDNAKVGLVVPAYMEDVNSIEDLNEHKEKFEGNIVGLDPRRRNDGSNGTID
ncbi:glycine betaine ABC transporter substrate-binding protein [Pontibacillus chungwhensis]|uniref:glycine betaine ABC transporter substrate-binding protein n=1 Tax=Pontibacillus chungwhensis TaxID=265426 RepID=UPI000AA9A675